jgi:hypothetical protein
MAHRVGAEAIQNAALNVARKIERYQDHSRQSPEGGPGVSVAFFQMIYQVLIGQERGPRFGSFVQLYGIAETWALIAKALAGELVEAQSRRSGAWFAGNCGKELPFRAEMARRLGCATTRRLAPSIASNGRSAPGWR